MFETRTQKMPLKLVGGLPFILLIPVIAIIIIYNFDGLYGQDPYAYYDYGTSALRDSLQNFQAIPPFFWPPGYPLLLSLLTFFIGITPLAGQIVSLLAGASIPLLTAALLNEIWDWKHWSIPLFAGLLTAMTPQLWQSSAVVMADTTALAAATLGVWALAKYGNKPANRLKWLGLATAAVSFAVLTRWGYALVAVPCFIYTLGVLRLLSVKQAGLHILGAAVVGIFVLSPVIPSIIEFLFSSSSPEAGTSFTGDLSVYTWSPLNAFRNAFETRDGLLRYSLPNGIYYLGAPAHRYFFTPIFALLLIPGSLEIFRKANWVRRLLIIGWAGMVFGFHAGAPWQNFRFALAYLPPLGVIAAIGLETTVRLFPQKFYTLIFAVVFLGILWMGFGGWQLTSNFAERKSAELAAVHEIRDVIEDEAQLLTFGLTLTFQHYTDIDTQDLFYSEIDSLPKILADSQATYLLINVDLIERQWTGRAPANAYEWLRDGPGLNLIDSYKVRGLTANDFQTYTLFQVNTR